MIENQAAGLFYSVNMHEPHSDRKKLGQEEDEAGYGSRQTILVAAELGIVFHRILRTAAKGEES